MFSKEGDKNLNILSVKVAYEELETDDLGWIYCSKWGTIKAQ